MKVHLTDRDGQPFNAAEVCWWVLIWCIKFWVFTWLIMVMLGIVHLNVSWWSAAGVTAILYLSYIVYHFEPIFDRP